MVRIFVDIIFMFFLWVVRRIWFNKVMCVFVVFFLISGVIRMLEMRCVRDILFLIGCFMIGRFVIFFLRLVKFSGVGIVGVIFFFYDLVFGVVFGG